MKRTYAILIAGITGVLILSGYGALADNGHMSVLVRNSGYDITLTGSEDLRSGTTGRLTFLITKNGIPQDIEQDLRSLHVVLSSADREDLFHTMTVSRSGMGMYSVDHAFTRTGPYRVWMEISNAGGNMHHGDTADLIAYQDVTVAGTSVQQQTLVRTQEVTAGSLIVSLAHEPLRSGESSALTYTLKDASGSLVPLMHDGTMFALVGEDFSSFGHGHFASSPDGLSATLTKTFSSPGSYALWTEVYVVNDGQLQQVIVPFSLTVL